MQGNTLRLTPRGIRVAGVIAMTLGIRGSLGAQYTERLARLAGIPVDFSAETRIGATTPFRANTGVDATFEWNVGSFGSSSIRPLFGLDVFHADLREGVNGIPVQGSMTSAGILGGLRIDANPDGTITPYAVTGLSADYAWANASDPATKDDLQGGRLGYMVGAGSALWFGAWPLALTGDVRHVFTHHMGRTTYSIGFRIQPRLRVITKQFDREIERVRGAIGDVVYVHGPSRPTVAGVVDTTRTVEIAIDDAIFLEGTAKLSEAASNRFAAIGDAVRKLPRSQITIDIRPRLVRACVAPLLARQRALVLREQLVRAGVGDASSIDVLGLEDSATGSAANGECRAATITIVGTQVNTAPSSRE